MSEASVVIDRRLVLTGLCHCVNRNVYNYAGKAEFVSRTLHVKANQCGSSFANTILHAAQAVALLCRSDFPSSERRLI